MSEIARWDLWDGQMSQSVSGLWVRYAAHEFEVERLAAELAEADGTIDGLRTELAEQDRKLETAQAEVERLQNSANLWQHDAQQLALTVDGLKRELHEIRPEAHRLRAEVKRLNAELAEAQDRCRALELSVEQADEMKAHAEASAAAEEAETDRVTAERDAAQREVERLTVRLEHAQARIVPPLPHAGESAQFAQDKMDAYVTSLNAELHETRERLARAQAQYDEFARVTAKTIGQHQRERDEARQQVYRLQQARGDTGANGQSMLDTSRPTDEDIWREAFMKQLFDHDIEKLMNAADVALALYRKRWPGNGAGCDVSNGCNAK